MQTGLAELSLAELLSLLWLQLDLQTTPSRGKGPPQDSNVTTGPPLGRQQKARCGAGTMPGHAGTQGQTSSSERWWDTTRLRQLGHQLPGTRCPGPAGPSPPEQGH